MKFILPMLLLVPIALYLEYTETGGDAVLFVVSALSLIQDGAIDAGNYIAAVGGLDAAEHLIRAVRAQELDGKGVIYPHVRSPLQSVDRWSAGRETEFITRAP